MNREHQLFHPSRWVLGLILIGLVVASFAIYARNLDDYFLGDDFDLVQSFNGEPPIYFVKLLFANESNKIWADLGIDGDQGLGYIRPVKIWTLKLDQLLWGTNATGFHLTGHAFFALEIVMVFLILLRLTDGRAGWATLGAGLAVIHPVFGGIVPWITAREESMVVGFGLCAIYAWLRFRLDGRNPVWFYLFFALALFTKEWGIFFVGVIASYDLLHGHARFRTRGQILGLLRVHAPTVVMLGVYMGFRWIAFGNFRGGGSHGLESGTSLAALHAETVRLFTSPHLNGFYGLSYWRPISLVVVAALIVALVLRRRRIGASHFLDLAVFGPLWYVLWAAIASRGYLSIRHLPIPTIGLIIVVVLALHGALRGLRPTVQWGAMALVAVIGGFAFLPLSLASSRQMEEASMVVQSIREEIEASTVELPDGSTVLLTHVPQLERQPYYFGWGLLSALRAPFTPSDLANRCRVYNLRNIAINAHDVEVPREFDLTLDFTGSGPEQ